MKQLNTRIAQKIDTSANWAKAVNFKPLEGELIIYSDLNKIKIGDGENFINDLPFSTGGVTYVTAIWDPDQSTLVCSHNPREIKKMVDAGQLVSLHYEGSFYSLADVWCDDDPDYLVDDCATFYYAHEDPHTSIWWVRGDKTIDQQDNYYATWPGVEQAIADAVAGIDSGTKNLVVTWDFFNQDLDATEVIPSHTHQEILEFYQNNPDAIITFHICSSANKIDIYYLTYINQTGCKFARSDDDYIYVYTFSNSSNLPTRTSYRLSKSATNGSSIFGDTDTNEATGSNAVVMGESSEALGDNSLAVGKEVQTGCKGYYIKAIDPAMRSIYLATDGDGSIPMWLAPGDMPVDYDSDFNTGYQVFDLEANPDLPSYQNEFSISSEDYYHWVFAGNIKTISGNCIIYDTPNILSDNPDKEHAAHKKWMKNFEGKAKPMKFYVPTQSEVGNIVTGHYTLAVGKGSVAADDYAVAEGRYNLAVGYAAHVEGDSNRAGYTGHAEGVRTQALGLGAHTEGQETVATGRFAHAQGSGSEATGDYGHAEGFYTQATGTSSHAQGSGSIASGAGSHASGANTVASGHHSFAGGLESIASGNRSFAFGNGTGTFAQYGVALGYKTQVGYADDDAGSLVSKTIHLPDVENDSDTIEFAVPAEATGITINYTGSDFDPGVAPIKAQAEGYGPPTSGVYLQTIEVYLGENTAKLTNMVGCENVVIGITSLSAFGGKIENITVTFDIPDNLGSSSLAFGSYAAALGNHSLAGGLYTTASGSRAFAFGEGSSDNRTEATGDVSIAMGKHVKATNTGSIALGSDTWSTGEYSVALGKNTRALASYAIANGIDTMATQSHAIALGSNSKAQGIASLAFGDTNNAGKAYTWALGQRNTVNAIHSLAIGRDNTTNGRFNFAFGENCLTNGDYSVAIGNGAIVDGANGIALGSGAYAAANEIAIGNITNHNKIGLFVDENANHSIDISPGAITFKGTVQESILSIGDFGITMDRTGDAVPPSIGEGVIAAGGGCAATGHLSVAISDFLDATGNYSFAMGQGQSDAFTETGEVIKYGAHGDYSVAFGYNANAEGSHSLAFGDHAYAADNFTLAFGAFASADAPNSVAIGGNATASGYSSFAFGDNAIAEADNAIAIGSGSKSSVANAVAIGTNAKATVDDAIAIGANAIANSPYTIAIGHGSNANKSFAVAIGYGNTASAAGAFALGYGTTAGGKYSATFGQNTSTAAEGAIAFGNTSKANVASGSGAYNSLVGGYYSESSHNATIVVGNQLRSANINGAVFGQYNSIEGLGATANDRALLILGNGSSDSARSNAFVVLRDGRMILGSGSHGTALPDSGYEGQIFFLES